MVKRCRCVCVCPPKNKGRSRNRGIPPHVTLTSLLGPSPFSPMGIESDFVQRVNPDLYELNNEYRARNEAGGCSRTGYPPDPSYPTDPRSDPLAYTPMYRGGQSEWLSIIDAWDSHGPLDAGNNASSPPVWYDWDGTVFPIYSPDTLTVAEKEQYRKDWYQFIFPNYPNDFIMRGLKQLYDSVQPFRDVSNPTVSEFELWNDKVLNLFRQMSGLPPATMSRELFIMNKWSKERKTTTMWDSEYPGTFDSAYGPCVGGTNLHCGSTFKPALQEEQAPYWNDYYYSYPCMPPHDLITLNQASEAITVWYNGNAFSAMSRNLRKLMEGAASGLEITGHAATFARRSLYGLNVGRAKWAGTLYNPPAGYSF